MNLKPSTNLFLFPTKEGQLGATSQSHRRRQWHPTPVLLPGKSHRRRSLVGCSPWGREESDITERLHFHFSLSCIGEGNDNPLQYSCLENPRDGAVWWVAIYGVAQSRTRLKRLSSSSQSHYTVSPLHANFWAFKDEKLSLYANHCIIVLFKLLYYRILNVLFIFCLSVFYVLSVWKVL